MHRGFGAHATALQRFVKQSCIRFGDADVFGAERKLEVIRQPQSTHISIAIGDHAEGVMVGENFQYRLDLGEHLDLMPRMQEHFKTFIRQLRRFAMGVTRLFQGVEQHPSAQGTDAVFEARFISQHPFADRPQMLHRHRAQIRRMFAQPFAQYRFGTDDYRSGVPQGVVEVEGDQLDAHESSPFMRLARGWALS
ncbi:hypothetical protein PS732_05281 [Pseudomonas fluorescens]|uniref:Uncharacterized protein n=1 Tax=Pseudomonas fluorescens TaxID=294 RepID=A0ABD7VKQ6_PSEFL|nr:hypothetical protein PS732_04346 [Pseudomonas fluorescens]VVP48391.1 hypothetical protein PS732_05281 [Pseudomonas fluorescens]